MQTRLLCCSSAALLCCTLLVTPALGGPVFSGLAAKADTAEVAATNPAGMSLLDGSSASLRLLLATGTGEFKVDETRTTTAGGDPDSDHSPVFVPLAYYVRQFNERWHAGISLTVPSGFGADYGGDWAGRYYSDQFSLVYVAITPALSYRISDTLSVGAALGINYTLSESEVGINTLGANSPDGRLEADLDGVGTNLTLSALWQATANTRFGIVYTSEAEAELDGKLKFRNLGPVLQPLLSNLGLLDVKLEVDNVLPQRVLGGIYHELASGAYLTMDAMWVDFSEFGTAAVSLNGTELVVDESGAFHDFWALSVGYGFPLANGRQFSIGAFYVAPPTDDDERGLSLALDRILGVGVGLSQQRRNGREMDFGLNLIDYGSAPVDTGPSLIRGRVAGKTRNPYALVLDFAYHW